MNVSAHGLAQIMVTTSIGFKILWTVIILCGLGGFAWMTITRIDEYYNLAAKVTYSETIESASDGIPLPSVSICNEGFSTEFVTREILVEYFQKKQEKLDNIEHYMRMASFI